MGERRRAHDRGGAWHKGERLRAHDGGGQWHKGLEALRKVNRDKAEATLVRSKSDLF